MQIAINKNDRKEYIEVGIAAVRDRLLVIMKDCIGQKEAIERSKLFKEVYGVTDESFKPLQQIALYDIMKRAMHQCRATTRCFITNVKWDNEYHYFVIKDKEDADCYANIADNAVKRLNMMKKRAYNAAEQQWWRLDWKQKA